MDAKNLIVRVPLETLRARHLAGSTITVEVECGSMQQQLKVDASEAKEAVTISVNVPASAECSIGLRAEKDGKRVGDARGVVQVDSGSVNTVLVLTLEREQDYAPSSASLVGRLTARTGIAFDLPTEAQWEYACRAGTTKAYNNDKDCLRGERDDRLQDENLDPVAWYGGNWNVEGEDSTRMRDVGLKQPNAWGLYDMLGNLWEYCLDWYSEYGPESVDPRGPAEGQKRVVRGGSWHAAASLCRSATRQKSRGAFRGQGVRLICSSSSIPPSIQCLVVDIVGGLGAEKFAVELRESTPADLLSDDAYRTTKLVLKRIQAGKFVMGSSPSELGRTADEVQHEVTLSQDCFFGVFMVTQKQWELLMQTNASVKRGEKLPIENIDWEECRGGTWPPAR